MTAASYTVKVQGTILQCTRGMDSPFTIGEIQDGNGLSNPVNDIPLGSWNDTEEETRPGRKKVGDFTFNLFLNPDSDAQIALKEMEGTDEIATYALISPEGTLTTRTFDAMVSQFGDDAKNDGVLMGHITLAVLTNVGKT